MVERHYLSKRNLELEGQWWIYLGKLVISFYVLAGRWVSLGFHLSFVPLYVDLHVIWFIVSFMSREHAAEIHEFSELYREGEILTET